MKRLLVLLVVLLPVSLLASGCGANQKSGAGTSKAQSEMDQKMKDMVKNKGALPKPK